jgi:hypothetical protein
MSILVAWLAVVCHVRQAAEICTASSLAHQRQRGMEATRQASAAMTVAG